MKPVKFIIMLGVIAMALVACNAEALMPTPTPLPNKDEVKNPDGPILVLQQSGGLDGVISQWALYADGRIEASDGSYRQATPEQVDQLLSEIEKLGFFELNNRYMPLNTCCDRIVYELSVRSEGRENHLTVLDATPDVPEAVWNSINTVSNFFAAYVK